MTRAVGMPQAKRRLRLVLGLNIAFFLVEAAGGFLSNSLALLSDAGHMLSDVAALALAFAAISQMTRPADRKRSFGYRRLEVLSALANGILLCGVAIAVAVEALERLNQPPEVRGGIMISVAAGGLLVNLIGLWLLHDDSHHSLGVRGAFLHMVGDTLGSIGAVTAALVILLTGWVMADSVVSLMIAGLIVVSGVHLIRESMHILLEGVPRHIRLLDLELALRAVEGVTDIHDLHVWRIGSGFDTLTVHLVVNDLDTWRARRDSVRNLLRDRFGITHSTVQVEACGEQNTLGCPSDPCERADG
jgi:cobalt-zinc-cadmium efflux system protein